MTRTRTAITAFTLVSVLALGACSDDDPQPKFAPTPSSSAPTSPSTTAASGPIEPTMPAAAQGTDAAAAEAFVRFYWETVNYAQATGDTDSLGELSTKCATCDEAVDYLEEVYRKKARITGGDGHFARLQANFLKRDGRPRVVVRGDLVSTKQRIDYPGSTHDETYPGGSLPFQFLVELTPDGWTTLFLGKR